VIDRTVSLLSNAMCQAGTTTVKNGVRTPTMWALLWILTVSSLFPGDAPSVVLKVDRGDRWNRTSVITADAQWKSVWRRSVQ